MYCMSRTELAYEEFLRLMNKITGQSKSTHQQMHPGWLLQARDEAALLKFVLDVIILSWFSYVEYLH